MYNHSQKNHMLCLIYELNKQIVVTFTAISSVASMFSQLVQRINNDVFLESTIVVLITIYGSAVLYHIQGG